MSSYGKLPFKTHPLRESIYEELHIRPFHVVSTPHQITHLALRASPEEQARAFAHICELCRRYSVNLPDPKTVTFQQDFGDFTIHWEHHVEFYSLTILRASGCNDQPFEHPVIDLLPADWMNGLPGEAVAAFHVIIEDQTLDHEPESLIRYFEGQRLSMSKARNGKAIIATAFRLHGDGYGRFIIQNLGMPDFQIGRLTRRIIEMETYRLLAQLSLPLAKQIAPQLADMDHGLADILARVPQLDSAEEERRLLQELTRKEAKLEMWRAGTNRRFSGSRAYHKIVLQRLEGISETRIEGYPMISEFMNRRLSPALTTLESIQNWMEDLSRRIERASDLLRTRVNLSMQEQNRCLLASMDNRSQLQFRLQETVEGLSVVAISYYLVGLLGSLLNGLPLQQWGLSKPLILTVSIPLTLLAVWWFIRRIKRRLIRKRPQRHNTGDPLSAQDLPASRQARKKRQ